MGRPISKKWFSVKAGSDAGDLQLTTSTGTEVIISQKGSAAYNVASGRVFLKDGTPTVPGEAQLVHNGKNVSKLTQYRVYYFDGTESNVWRDEDGAIVGTFVPPLAADPIVVATATADVADGAITGYSVTYGGKGYASAPAVTVSAPDGTDAVLGDVTLVANAITNIAVTDGGSGYIVAPAITITDAEAGSGATAVAVLTNGSVTSVNVTAGGADYSNVTVSIAAVPKVQETATATVSNGEVTAITSAGDGEGYAAATVSIAAP